MRKSPPPPSTARRPAAWHHPYEPPAPPPDRKTLVALEIETAALELFAQKGIAEVTVEEIAEKAGISRRTFYRYFETPEDVLAAMPERLLERIASNLRFRPIGEDIPTSFLTAVRHASAAIGSEGKIQTLAQRVRRRSPALWARAMARVHTQAVALLEGIFAERLGAQQRDPESAGPLAATLISLFVYVQLDALRKAKEPTEADFAKALASLSILAPPPAAKKPAAARKRAK